MMNNLAPFYNPFQTFLVGARGLITSFLFSFIFISPHFCYSQEFNFIPYGIRDGLPQSEVTCIAQGSHGYLWIGTKGGGICKFDGKKFQSFSQKEGLPSKFINAICKDENDSFWIGTSKGIAIQKQDEFSTLNDFDFHVSALAFLSDNQLVVGGPKGLYKLWLNDLEIVKKEFYDVAVNEIKNIPQGKISVSTDDGWMIFGSEYFESVQLVNGLASNNIVTTVSCSSNCIWVISETQGMTKHSIKNPKRILERLDSPRGKVNSSFFQNNQIWLGTNDKGYFVQRENEWEQIGLAERLPSNGINQIFEDSYGQKWMASSQGLIKLLERSFKVFGEKSGLPNLSIQALAEDAEGVVWIGMNNGGLASLENNEIQPYLLDKDFLNGKITSLCFDELGRLWAGTADKGIAVLDSLGLYQIINEGRGLSSNEIKTIVRDEYGIIWVGTNRGISKIEISTVDSLEEFTISQKDKTKNYSINDIAFDQTNHLWFSSTSGNVGRISDEDKFLLFDEANGLPGTPINSISFDDQYKIWLGTAGNGLYTTSVISNRPSFSNHPVSNKLSSSFVNFINIDLAGDLWIGSEKGVDRFNSKEQNINVSSFGYDQGFLGGETNLNAAITDRYGKLWFGSVNGLTSASTDIIGAEMAEPNLFFSSISIQNELIKELPNSIIAQNEWHDYNWDVNQVNFKFQGVQLNYPQEVQYRWKLDGLEKEWSPLGFNQQVLYSNLESGQYIFLAEATCDGSNYGKPIQFKFAIEEPIWEKTWFKFLIALIGLILISSIVFSRIQQVRKREREKRQNLEIKNKLLELNQKALQLQMNPHFIFNTLNSINSLVAKNENQEARKQINNFAKQLRSTLSNSRKEYISLETEISSLKEYLKMLQFCHEEPFEYEIKSSPSIQVEEIELPPMIIQPFVENAVLHGFNELAHLGLLQIHFSMQGQLLECVIEDNGIGRKAATSSKAKKSGAHESAGMEVTLERLNNLKGKLNYKSLEIFDKTEDGKAIGTKVIIRLPYRVSY